MLGGLDCRIGAPRLCPKIAWKIGRGGQNGALQLRSGCGTVGRCTGPKWTKIVQTTILVKMTLFRTGIFAFARPKWTKMVHSGPFRSANPTLATPHRCCTYNRPTDPTARSLPSDLPQQDQICRSNSAPSEARHAWARVWWLIHINESYVLLHPSIPACPPTNSFNCKRSRVQWTGCLMYHPS